LVPPPSGPTSFVKVRVLGAAAGGGLPQWNCGCPNCSDARAASSAVQPQTQSSIAVSAGPEWVLFNASPDVRAQIEAFPPLQPTGLRGSPIGAVVLTDAEVDHTAGLLLLREGGELAIASTAFVRSALEQNGLLPTLGAYLSLHWTEIVPGQAHELSGTHGEGLGLDIEAFEVAGDPPLYYRGDGGEGGHTVGLRVRPRTGGAALVYVPGAGAADQAVLDRIASDDVLLWDGTFWTDDELKRLGISRRTAKEMGHLPISGPGGSLDRFRGVEAARKIYIHINNTNPILRSGSPERLQAEAAEWEVAFDGMELDI
jgi:pyrroloquinoline quinone biosynthesis protein B